MKTKNKIVVCLFLFTLYLCHIDFSAWFFYANISIFFCHTRIFSLLFSYPPLLSVMPEFSSPPPVMPEFCETKCPVSQVYAMSNRIPRSSPRMTETQYCNCEDCRNRNNPYKDKSKEKTRFATEIVKSFAVGVAYMALATLVFFGLGLFLEKIAPVLIVLGVLLMIVSFGYSMRD